MKVGDLVLVKPARDTFYVITSMTASLNGRPLIDCVTVASTVPGKAEGRMGIEWIEVVSK